MHAKINGTTIYFDVEGAGLRQGHGKLDEKPVIVALHGGLGLDHGYLRHGVGALRDDAQVIYVDMRGQGRSARADLATCSLEQMADDVAALCELLSIDRAFLLGHSAGGFVAMHAALRHPALVAGLMLCGSSPTVRPLLDDPNDPAPTLAGRAGAQELAVATRLFSGEVTLESVNAFFAAVGPYYLAPANMHLFEQVFKPTTITIEMMQHFMGKIAPTYDLLRDLERIKAPTIAMVGRHDWVCPPRASRAIARGIPGAQLVEFNESGHFVFSEEPAKFRDTVTDFVTQHCARP
ncbi:alpha/beta fold hydrolase [Paraburkholderia rhizosphaerae]|uniref:Proline iminopeptidase n=1 Tax=Paraburkholderia rhizosphaerae TaxID=480658 RepID=A0A4R8LX21_9BURK|nr:alpha/beta hydrolase [Paraburkholderia rhizosphaerae]TDY52730.1 proline iminopeptidase [Paraburkholderia rhizosphaerae]